MSDPSETGSSSSSESLIFVSDASAEAEKLTAGLRTRGYVVVDVPLALLLSRVGVQRPAIVLCDADAPSALEIIERMRDVPGGGKVDVLFFGERDRVLNEQAERVARQASAIFPRPVDSAALSVKIEALIGPPRGGSARPSSLLPQGNRVPVLVAATRRPYRYDTRARARNLPDLGEPRSPLPRTDAPGENPSPPLQPLPQDLIGEAALPSRGLSSDLQALLGRAEQRVQESRGFLLGSERLSPEAELEAVLPSDLLSALDEPLDELDEDDDDDVGTPGTQGSDSHASRGGSRTGPESAAGTAPGGSVNPFAPREITTSGGDHAERSPSEHGELGARERTANGGENSAPSRRELPTLPPNLRGRTAPPSTTHIDPALGTLVPSAARADKGSMLTDLAVSTEPPKGTELPSAASEPAAEARTDEPPKQVSTKPPRPGRSDEPRGFELREERNSRDFSRNALRDSELAPPTPHQSAIPASNADIVIPPALRSGDAIRILARAVRARYSGAIAFEDDGGIRRVVLRDGDFVMAAAGIDNESLTAFLAQRGDLPADVATRLGRKLPQFGRHAGAALIAQGHLRQEDLWPVLRAHAEWLITRIATLTQGAAGLEHVVPPRLASEPSVFGGATGAEVLLEVVRRAVPPSSALGWLGGPGAEITPGDAQSLIAECALADAELEIVRTSSGATISELMERSASQELPTVLFGLVELGILRARPSTRKPAPKPRPPTDVIDHEAVRARIRARRALVDEGDYFSLLGVPRNATTYDIRRAYTNLLQEFEPSRILTPLTTDLQEDVDVILEVLDEAYEILRDEVRRERYLRALEEAPR